MVDVNPVNKNTSVNVSSSGTVSQIKTTTPQSYFDGLSKQWAISEDKVQGLDYSSKYYAQQAKENSQEAISALENVETVTTNAINQITTTKNETLDGIYDISSQTQQEITELKETLKADLENTKVSAVDEVVQNKTNALDEIENTSVKEQEELNKIKEEIIEEGEKQLQNVQSTGFYMRDDKLYFINSKGEEEEFKSGGGGAGAVMFDTKISDHILEGEEAKGWALQGTYVSGALYPDFYNKCLEEYKNSSKSWNGSNVSLVGSVVDNQGVLSGFSSSSYAEMTSYYQGVINSLEFVTCVTIGQIGVQQNIFGQTKTNQATFQLQMLTSGKIELLASSVGSTSWDVGLQTLNAVTSGSTYWIKTTFNNTTGYEFYLSENGIDYVLQASKSTTTAPKWTEAYQIGNDVAHATNAFKGSIDLKETYIDVNGSRYWTGASTIAKNSNGHKFYLIAEKSVIDSVYNQYGIADFYGIDEANERIFLPRNKYFQQLTNNTSLVNQFVEAGLPNIKSGTIVNEATNPSTTSGPFKTWKDDNGAAGSSGSMGNMMDFDASRCSSVYGKSSTVQPPSSLKLLYYCVGNTVVNDADIDAGGLVAQMELKANKTDVDGQWAKNATTLLTSVSITSSYDVTLDLSEYLPNDGYAYEVMLNVSATTGATSGNKISIITSSNICPPFHIIQLLTSTASTNAIALTTNMPVGADKQLRIQGQGTIGTGGLTLYLRNWRRLGQNQ